MPKATNARGGASAGVVKINEFVWPRATFEWLLAGGTFALYVAGAASHWIVPGTSIWTALTDNFPGGPERFLWITRTASLCFAVSHAFEAVLFDPLRLSKHGVARFSSLWWKWELCVFIEGLVAWKRIGSLIARKQGRIE